MFSPKTTQSLRKHKSTLSALLVLLLLFTQISSSALAGPSTHVVSTAGDYRETPNQERDETAIAYPAPEATGGESHLEGVGEMSRDEYADPVFASIVSEFTDQDTYIAPTFVAEDGSVVNSVVFDDVGSCVPVLIPATEGV